MTTPPEQCAEPAAPPRGRGAGVALLLLAAVSLLANVWGNAWGAPDRWHPDEITHAAVRMASHQSLDPQAFAYGGAHYYTLMVGAVLPVYVHAQLTDPRPPSEGVEHDAWRLRVERRVLPLARWISALYAAATVCMTALLGARLFGRTVGLVAAALLAVCMSFVTVAHFATVDAAANAWYWLACLLAVCGWQDGRRRWWVLAAIVAGVAVGTKIDRALVVIPLLTAFTLRGGGWRIGQLTVLAGLVVAGFVATNPLIVWSPFQYLDGFTRDAYFNVVREAPADARPPPEMFWNNLRIGLGWPLLGSALLGAAGAVVALVTGPRRAAVVLLLAMALPNGLLFATRLNSIWYLVLLFPALMLGAAAALLGPSARGVRGRVGGVVAVAVWVCAAFYTAGILQQFTDDGRIRAAEWINTTLPDGATILCGARGPLLSDRRFQLSRAPIDPEFFGFATRWRERLDAHDQYLRVRRAILDAERWAADRVGWWGVRPESYTTWFDHIRAAPPNPPSEDFVVLVDYVHHSAIARLSAPGSGYRVVRRFGGQEATFWTPAFMFVNPEVVLFATDGAADLLAEGAGQDDDSGS